MKRSNIAILLLLASVVQAEERDFPSARHAVGFGGGGVVGSGLTYRRYFNHSYIQTAFFGRVTEQDDVTNMMAGLSYGNMLSELAISTALPPTALVFVTGLDGQYIYNPDPDETLDEPGTYRTFRTGAGIELEIGNTFTPGLLFSVGITYALAMEEKDEQSDWNLGPLFHFEILYNWE